MWILAHVKEAMYQEKRPIDSQRGSGTWLSPPPTTIGGGGTDGGEPGAP